MKQTLVVVSKIKDYIKESELNTSSAFIDELSEMVRKTCDEAIQKALASKRKTVLDRDI